MLLDDDDSVVQDVGGVRCGGDVVSQGIEVFVEPDLHCRAGRPIYRAPRAFEVYCTAGSLPTALCSSDSMNMIGTLCFLMVIQSSSASDDLSYRATTTVGDGTVANLTYPLVQVLGTSPPLKVRA